MTQIHKKEFEQQLEQRPDSLLPFQEEPGTEQLLSEYIDRKQKGVKFDSDKIQYELLPPELLEEVAKILTFGAKKYSERNWEYGMDWSRPFGALNRHLWAWWDGEEKDPETGESHLSHAGCCLAFLIAYEQRGIGNDNRWKGA